MPGTISATQDWDNGILTRRSGFNLSYDLMLHADMSTDSGDFNRGAVGYLDADGEFVAGYDADAVPMFTINAADDRDVDGQVGNAIDQVLGLIPATGSFEICTTEFNAAGTYAPNTKLTPSQTTDGDVTPAPTNYNDVVLCGVVTKGVIEDEKAKVDTLCFLTYYSPVIKITALS